MSDQNERSKILVVDDEENIRHYLQLLLQHENFKVYCAANAEEALEQISTYSPEIVLCDIRMPGKIDGLGLLEHLRDMAVNCNVVMMSAYGSRDTALEAVQMGAYDYIDKPIKREDLILTLRKLQERERLRHENRRLREALDLGRDDAGIIGESDSIRRVLELARKVATFPSTVMINGESGTGKELLARAVHRWSDRADKAFVAINCGSIPENLLESELFGYSRGAFTGADRDKEGLFETASGGVLFLDEIGELPLSLQVKLLRVLQESKLRRLGDTLTREIDVRIITATNRDLSKEVEAGTFRQDLYYRLHVITLELPLLKDRQGDIPLLLDFYLGRFNARFGTNLKGATVDAMKALSKYHWPGNIRELKNVVERAIILEDSERLTVNSLPQEVLQIKESKPIEMIAPEEYSIKKGTRRLEKELIKRALQKTKGNRSAASRILEISHRALLYKIKQYEIAS